MLPFPNCRLFSATVLGCALSLSPCSFGQGVSSGSRTSTAQVQLNGNNDTFTLYICVRERSGIPLGSPAVVRLSAAIGGQFLMAPVQDASTAVFTNLLGGDYEAVVEAPGYETATERVSLIGGSPYTAYVYLAPAGTSTDKNNNSGSGIVMTPDLQREMDRGLVALTHKNYDEARKHFQKAHKMSPGNPDVLYLLGMVDYTAKDIPAARKQFEAVLANYPAHQHSLIMLGQIQLDAGENQEAQATLQKAVDAGTVNWQAHYLLAIACARTGAYEKARIECQRGGELNKQKKPLTDLLEAKLYLMEGRNSQAKSALESFLDNYPSDPGATEAKNYLAKLDEAAKPAELKPVSEKSSAPGASPVPTDAPLSNPALEKPWAPPQVDAAVPPVAPGISCSSDEVLQKTQKRVLAQLSDLEKFGATEHIEHQVVDSYGVPGAPASHDFEYLIFVYHSKKLPYYFDEMRDGSESLYSFPTRYATRGLVSLAFLVIHPVFSHDFQFACEGLGTWNGQPAWQIHFVQRADVTSRIRTWSYHQTVYPIPLKGRIWIGANSYNIVHLETDLRDPDPVPELRLNREQLIVDYGPVHFQSANVALWLPWHADMYFELQGKRYHHRHTLSNYVLFDVNTTNKISAPPEPAETKDN